jgi:hypothetical protein
LELNRQHYIPDFSHPGKRKKSLNTVSAIGSNHHASEKREQIAATTGISSHSHQHSSHFDKKIPLILRKW